MAIQHRRGIYENFDPTKLLPGEWAIVLSGDSSAEDGRAAYMCFAAGDVKRMATFEDMEENIDAKTASIIQAAVVALAEEVAHINAEALPDMAANQRGIAKLGSGLKMANSTLSVDTTSTGVIAQSEKGSANGVAELDANGLVPSAQLPSYVDDVLEYASSSGFPATGETGKIYIALDMNLTYRWSGSAYVEISPSLALGETSSTAYRGDRGADAYAHAVTNKGTALASGLYKVTTNSEGHVTAGTAVQASDITGLISPLGISNGGTGATSAAAAKAAIVDGQALAPASVAATGAVTAVKNGTTYSLGDVGESVSKIWLSNTTDNPIEINMTMPNDNVFYLTYREDQRALVADMRINGSWLGQKTIASWN